MVNHEEKAKEYFKSGYNCSQSVFLAYAEEMGLNAETALKISSSFGGGMGRLREVCGAVSGMFMAVGLALGYTDKDDRNAKKEHYERIQYLAKEFEKLNGSIVCRTLLGLDVEHDNPTPAERNKEYYKKRPCVELVGDACRILDKYFQEQKEKEEKVLK